ncbi:hypothetical protein FKP32DRAFT_526817 [Trametes sanguinea]|nr:hypothetical protein FKP32DRAFT_526817 [Trametes sanguinea]
MSVGNKYSIQRSIRKEGMQRGWNMSVCERSLRYGQVRGVAMAAVATIQLAFLGGRPRFLFFAGTTTLSLRGRLGGLSALGLLLLLFGPLCAREAAEVFGGLPLGLRGASAVDEPAAAAAASA